MVEGLQMEKRSRVLVLDDDTSQLDTLSAILKDEGFEVLVSQTAAAGIEQLRRGDVDVAIVDLRLPDATEVQLLDSLAELADDVASIIHTGYSSYQTAQKAVNIGAFAYVEKGGDPNELLREVHRAIQVRLVQRAEMLEKAVAERTRNLQEAKDYTDSIIRSMANMLVVVSPEGEIVTVNEATCTTLAYAEDELIGRPAALLFEEEDIAKLILSEDTLPFKRTVLNRMIREGFVSNIEKSFLTKAGDRMPVLISGSVMRDDQDKIRAIVCLALDITKRKRAEEALLLRDRAVNAAAEGISITDPNQPDHPAIFVNQGFESLTGYSADEVLGRNIRFLQGPDTDPDTVDQLRRAIAQGEPTTVELQNYRKDGSPFWNRIAITPVKDDAGAVTHFIGIHADVTEQRLTEEQLRHTQKMEAVGQLAAGVAHEFNNLLFGILGSAEIILATKEGELGEQLERPLRDIKTCGRRGAALTKQLLSFARKKKPEISQFDINQVVGDLSGVIQRMLTETIALETDLASDLPPIEADRGEIEQALLNLASNAHDAMPDGGKLTIRTATQQFDENRVSTYPQARPGTYVQLSVADTGCGMPPETVNRIFEPFFTTKPVGQGTGLGLSTVFADVTKIGGIIEVESHEGEGTAFRIFLPSAKQSVDTDSDDANRSAEQFLGGSETILVVDDDEVVLDSAAFVLEMQGYTVLRALGAPEGLKAAADHDATIDLLITDVTMPEMNGWELSRKLIAQRPDMKVIFISGYAQDVLEAGATEGEHIEFLEKPPEGDALFRRIRKVLDAAKSETRNPKQIQNRKLK